MTTHNVGFFNVDDNRDDETQFDVESMDDLYELFKEFCIDNKLPADTPIDYIDYVCENKGGI